MDEKYENIQKNINIFTVISFGSSVSLMLFQTYHKWHPMDLSEGYLTG
jgi:hypothetical protein